MAENNFKIAQAYMVFGGVPFYYTLLDKTQSLAQNIDRLFFESKNAVLRVEFSELFSSLFNKPEKYLSVIEIFAEKKEGFTREEISKKTGITGVLDGKNYSIVDKEIILDDLFV